MDRAPIHKSKWAFVRDLPAVKDNKKAVVLTDAVIEPADVAQGSFGDCWFVAALANLAMKPDRIEELFLFRSPASDAAGLFCVRFYFWVRM